MMAEHGQAGLANRRRPGLGARLALALLWVYRCCVSPFKPRCCRFSPSCSQYAREAILTHGLVVGVWLASRRLLRCHPLYRGSLYDPVPGLCSPAADSEEKADESTKQA